MYRVTQEISFCYGHRLLRYQGKCARLHGHNGTARITLGAEALDGQGMVADFDGIEKTMRAFIDETIDHRLLLHKDDALCGVLEDQREPFVKVDFNPTAENIARMIFERAARQGYPVVQVELVEQQGSIASYSP